VQKVIIVTAIAILSHFCFGQKKCPEPKEENYKKVMSPASAKDFEKCPVIITAEYFKEGFANNTKKPGKFKSMYVFQCVNPGDNGNPAPVTNEICGDFFAIDRDNADEVLNLKKGNIIKFTGVTTSQNVWGKEPTTFFLVNKVEQVNSQKANNINQIGK
jgi:hypothetical protein